MIKVVPRDEPAHFNEQVRQPGKRFLAVKPHPTQKEWKRYAYWLRILDDLYNLYNGICAYCCEYIPPVTGGRSVEHFLPKDQNPPDAYEWENYRLVSLTMNGRKGIRNVLDPFQVQNGWFTIDFPSLQVKPGRNLPADLTQSIWETIEVLKLNSESCVESRVRWVRDFCRREITAVYLGEKAPFIFAELQRQSLVPTIGQIMNFS
jgi:hypothetical protein